MARILLSFPFRGREFRFVADVVTRDFRLGTRASSVITAVSSKMTDIVNTRKRK
jgi:hypothetical protein